MSTFSARTAVLCLALLATVTACSNSGSTAGAQTGPEVIAEPGGTAASSPASIARPATGARTTWGPVSLELPAGLTPVEAPSTETVHRFGAVGPVGAETQPAALAVVVQDRPERRAKAEADSGAEVARRAGGAANLRLRSISVPGASAAWSLEYDELPLSADQKPLHRGSVIADVGDRLVVIEARATGAEYQDAGLAAALASVRLAG
jgi:hypothetical protein